MFSSVSSVSSVSSDSLIKISAIISIHDITPQRNNHQRPTK